MCIPQQISYRWLRAAGFYPMSKDLGCSLDLGGGFRIDYFDDSRSMWLCTKHESMMLSIVSVDDLRTFVSRFGVTLTGVDEQMFSGEDVTLSTFVSEVMQGRSNVYLKRNKGFVMIFVYNEMRRLEMTHSLFDIENAVESAYEKMGIEI